jgi:EpsI family protein
MTKHLVILSVCFIVAAGLSVRAMRPELVPLRESLDNFPTTIDRWAGRDAPKFTDDIMAILGVDEYVNRIYVAPSEAYTSLYIGYYQSQREGDTIHSPLNCLPGAGWIPMVTGRTAIQVQGRTAPIEVNRFVIQKGLDRQVVLYWYQSHGRVIADEYWSKAYMIYDAMRFNRSDAAMIRVVSPVLPSDKGDAAAERRVTEFVQALFPLLGTYLPS